MQIFLYGYLGVHNKVVIAFSLSADSVAGFRRLRSSTGLFADLVDGIRQLIKFAGFRRRDSSAYYVCGILPAGFVGLLSLRNFADELVCFFRLRFV